MSKAEEVNTTQDDEVEMKEYQIRSYLKSNPSFLENFVVEKVDLEIIEGWIIKKVQKETEVKLKIEDRSDTTYAVPSLGSSPGELWPPKIAGTPWDTRAACPKAATSAKAEFVKASSIMNQRMAAKDPKSEEKDENAEPRTSASKFIITKPEAPLSVRKKDMSRKM